MPSIDHHQPGEPSWIDVSSTDIERSGRFYADLFGWDVGPDQGTESGGYRMMQLDGRDVAGLGPSFDGAPPHWNVYVSVDDVDATIGTVESAGGSVLMGAMDVVDAGRMAVVADPCGAPLSLWQRRAHGGFGVADKPASFTWAELTVSDPDASERFLNEVLGWTSTTEEMEGVAYRMLRRGDRPVAGIMPMDESWGPEPPPPHWMVYLAVDDTDATCERAAELGGTVCVPATDIAPGRFAVLEDPTGATFSVIRMAG